MCLVNNPTNNNIVDKNDEFISKINNEKNKISNKNLKNDIEIGDNNNIKKRKLIKRSSISNPKQNNFKNTTFINKMKNIDNLKNNKIEKNKENSLNRSKNKTLDEKEKSPDIEINNNNESKINNKSFEKEKNSQIEENKIRTYRQRRKPTFRELREKVLHKNKFQVRCPWYQSYL